MIKEWEGYLGSRGAPWRARGYSPTPSSSVQALVSIASGCANQQGLCSRETKSWGRRRHAAPNEPAHTLTHSIPQCRAAAEKCQGHMGRNIIHWLQSEDFRGRDWNNFFWENKWWQVTLVLCWALFPPCRNSADTKSVAPLTWLTLLIPPWWFPQHMIKYQNQWGKNV